MWENKGYEDRGRMSIDTPFRGSLFANDFLCESITESPDWQAIDDSALDALKASVRDVFAGFPIAGSPNESQTEDDLIWPVLLQLGWKASLRQQNLSAQGREDVPDGLLFTDAAAKDRANGFTEEWKRYEFGLAVVESKRWGRPLDRRSGRRGEENAPSTQMLRYLRRVDDLTTGKLRWGILTNGARWRLYYQGARSVSEQFFEVDLAALLNLPGHNEGLFPLTDAARHHGLKVFVLVFRREAFVAGTTDPRTFHQRAIEEGRFYEERVAASLSGLVFGQVFPGLARAIAADVPAAPLPQVREAALILLYRRLFILYAEDRDLLPVRNKRYDDYALREKVRGDVGQRKDRDDVFSASAARYWSAIDDLCRAIDQGDASIGLPPYNGGLFDRQRVPLLTNIRLGDEVMAEAIDALSFEQTPEGRRYINYRDLGVQQLGSIYERLLEHEIVRDDGEIAVRPNVFARKGSGSYYTPDDLVGLILKETIEPLVRSRMDAFTAKNAELATSHLPEDRRIGQLKQLDPAERLLELKICDPAMGSGHFLVNLVDHLADRVITAMAEAEASVDDYISPLTERIDVIRNKIMANAEKRGWTIDAEQLDDRHIVRRMVLKRCVYGVDKNPMAVELAKVALWLHTFTVGAPLSFLDHHLRCGDSLSGSWVRTGIDRATEQGAPLFLEGPVKRATRAAAPMQIIEGLTDAEIAEAHRSAEVFAEIEEMTTPLNAFLSLVHAFDWLNIRDRDDKAMLYAYYAGIFGDPIDIASGKIGVSTEAEGGMRFAGLLDEARQLLDVERFFNWQVAFPGVWSEWESTGLNGGFDAVIGNPPWDRMKLQQVEWFAARRREIALAPRAADRQEKANNEDKRNREASAENQNARVNHHHQNFLNQWWLLSYPRSALMKKLRELPRYVACGQVTKRPIFVFVDANVNPNAALQVFTFADDYSFGILQSDIHWRWFVERCSTFKGDFRYTSTTVYDSFPWPQAPSLAQVREVARAAVDIRLLRAQLMEDHDLTLRELYRSLELPGDSPLKRAHARLDAAVRKAYKMRANEDALELLFGLNQKLAEQEASPQQVIGPGLPPAVKDTFEFITEDRVS